MKKKSIKYLFSFSILFFANSCRENTTSDSTLSYLKNESTQIFNEGDTLILKGELKYYQNWLNWHQQFDPQFNNGKFKSSGVSIHFDQMENVLTTDSTVLLTDLFIKSPDSTQYVDLYSYSYIKDQNQYLSGEADQLVVLGKKNDLRSRKQVMFLGISQVAEFAEWVSKHSFIIGLNSRNEKGDSSQYEIYLFNLKESSYINFMLDHTIPVIPDSFIDFSIQKSINNK